MANQSRCDRGLQSPDEVEDYNEILRAPRSKSTSNTSEAQKMQYRADTRGKDLWNRYKIGTRVLISVIIVVFCVYSYQNLFTNRHISQEFHETIRSLILYAFMFVSAGLNGIEAFAHVFKKKDRRNYDNFN